VQGPHGSRKGRWCDARQGSSAIAEAMHEIRSSICDCRPERERLRAAAANEAKARIAVEQRRRAVAEECAGLEAEVAAAEQELSREQAYAIELQAQATRELSERGHRQRGLQALWPEAEEASAALRRADAEAAVVRERALELEEAARQRLQASSCLYQFYTAATGVRWDLEADARKGYVSIGDSAQHFDVSGLEAKAAADTIWDMIEACLPPAGKAATVAAATTAG